MQITRAQKDYLMAIDLAKQSSLFKTIPGYKPISSEGHTELLASVDLCLRLDAALDELKLYIYNHFVVDNAYEPIEVYRSIVSNLDSLILVVEELIRTSRSSGPPERKIFRLCFAIYIEELIEIKESFLKGS